MKYLRGYLTAGILGALTFILMQYAKRFETLIDMVYPYIIRNVQGVLAEWSGQVNFCLWQLLAAVLGVIALASLVLAIVLKWNPIEWFGWILAGVAAVYLLQTAMYGLNYYASDLADDIRLSVSGYTLNELTDATCYYRDKANKLADRIDRDENGTPIYDDFETLAANAGDGFEFLKMERYYPVFAGSTLPVKKLGWADMYTSMGITGFTCGITGEAAVNPQAPVVSLPFTMCHEMCHRMCIASERDANFGAFLAASSNSNRQYRYSAYFMAFRYCYSSLCAVSGDKARAAAQSVADGIGTNLARDMADYDNFYQSRKSETNTRIADTVNDTYLKTSGETSGIRSYGEVCDLLTNWYIQEVVMPGMEVEESYFDPFDESKVDLSDIVRGRAS